MLVENTQFIITSRGTFKATYNQGVVSIQTETDQSDKINGNITLKLKDGKYLVHIEFAEVDTGSGSYLLWQKANGDKIIDKWTNTTEKDADLNNGWIDMREVSFGPIRQFPGRKVTKLGNWLITTNSPWWEARPGTYNNTVAAGDVGSVTYPPKKE